MKNLKDIVLRCVAVVVVSFMGVLGAGSVVGIEVWQAGLIAAVLGLASVLEDLSRAYLRDGKLTKTEIDQAFNDFEKKQPKK